MRNATKEALRSNYPKRRNEFTLLYDLNLSWRRRPAGVLCTYIRDRHALNLAGAVLCRIDLVSRELGAFPALVGLSLHQELNAAGSDNGFSRL
jgi:hypothetical protein